MTQQAIQQQQATMEQEAQNAPATQPQTQTQTAKKEQQGKEKLPAGVCPRCGTQNDPDALFCENCGMPLRRSACPKCNSDIEPGLDYCEKCHQYIDEQHCSFCGGAMSISDSFCTTCGSQRAGIVCPICHTLSHFSFCDKCSQPLTDSARRELKRVWNVPFEEEVRAIEAEMEELFLTEPMMGYDDRKRQRRADEIRDRVRELLAMTEGGAHKAQAPNHATKERPTVADLAKRLEECRTMLQQRLDEMAMGAQPSSAIARNIAMACRPKLSRLGWRCNWKDALHPSPLNCACPQKGGRWVVLNDKNEKELDVD